MKQWFHRPGAFIQAAAQPAMGLSGAWPGKIWTTPTWTLLQYPILNKTMENAFSLKDKVIIVTGGTGILGNSFVTGIAEAGGTVGILGRNEAVARERAQAINQKGGK